MARPFAILLNPKAIRFFRDGEWEARGSPWPIVTAQMTGGAVVITDPTGHRVIGQGYLGSDTYESEGGGTYLSVGTSDGVEPKRVGYGLMLYSALAVAARTFKRAQGIGSDSRSREADELWESMVEADFAEHEDGGEKEGTYEDYCHDVEGEEVDDYPRDGVTATLHGDVCGSVDVTYVAPEFDYLPYVNVMSSGIVIASMVSDEGRMALSVADAASRVVSGGRVPADLIAQVPLRGPKDANFIHTILRRAGAQNALRRFYARGDVMTDEGQYLLPGSKPVPREAQQKLFGLGGFGALRGAPANLKLSPAANAILNRFGNVG